MDTCCTRAKLLKELVRIAGHPLQGIFSLQRFRAKS
jgi:hypothetical protein